MAKKINMNTQAALAFIPTETEQDTKQTAQKPQTAPKRTKAKKSTPKTEEAATGDHSAPQGNTGDFMRQLLALSDEDRAKVGELFGIKPNKPGKERKTYHLHALIRQSTANALEAYAEQIGASKAAILEEAIKDYLKRKGSKTP